MAFKPTPPDTTGRKHRQQSKDAASRTKRRNDAARLMDKMTAFALGEETDVNHGRNGMKREVPVMTAAQIRAGKIVIDRHFPSLTAMKADLNEQQSYNEWLADVQAAAEERDDSNN